MRILYTTDLHGNKNFYQFILKKIKSCAVDIIVNGGDMLPKTEPIFTTQIKFLEYLEKEYFPIFEKKRIHYLCQLGNDDLKIYDQRFDAICNQFKYIHNIAQRKIIINSFEFIGFNFVTDYPFGLKDRCRKDTDNFKIPIQYDKPVFSDTGDKWDVIRNWPVVINSFPSILSELKVLPKPQNLDKTIYIIHMPPAGLGLDQTIMGNRPKSFAVRKFLDSKQPLLSFHGHIHNSYQESGVWKKVLGKTICVQPGQGRTEIVFVILDLETMILKRFSQKDV